jgi:carbon storage regulator CsrA
MHMEVATMLVLSRKVGESILIGDSIVVTVVRLGQAGARVGIEAPPDMTVIREELAREPTARHLANGETSAGNVALEATTAIHAGERRTKSAAELKRVAPR